jgi:hypothetical protein
MAAVRMKPTIIITHTMVAAGARRSGTTRTARSVSKDVPDAPTPTPMAMKESVAPIRPRTVFDPIKATDSAAETPPRARTAMPPMIQGVRRPPISDP